MKNATDWAYETFKDSDLGDTRRTERLIKLASSHAQKMGASTVSCCDGDDAQIEGAYRFIRNDHIKASSIREGGYEATLRAVKNESIVLALEDTTTLSYKHKVLDELGYTSNSETARSKGFQVHSVLLLSEETERTVGLIEQSWYCRDKESYGKRGLRMSRAYEEKESYKWEHASRQMTARLGDLQNRVISVCDREADIYDYLYYKQLNEQRFIVRASQNRKTSDSEEKLFTKIFSNSRLGTYEVEVQQKGGRKKRTAKLEYFSDKLEIELPKHQRGKGYPDKLAVNVVAAREKVSQPENDLSWILLTTEPVDTAESAQRILHYYALRWRIEDYHKAWKSGIGVETLRLQSKDNLERAGSVLAFVAVRLLQMREIAVTKPTELKEQVAVTTLLTEDEWHVLWIATQKKKPPKKIPTIEWAYKSLGKLGGWYDSKRTGIIGWKALWEGWFRLMDKVDTYQEAKMFL